MIASTVYRGWSKVFVSRVVIHYARENHGRGRRVRARLGLAARILRSAHTLRALRECGHADWSLPARLKETA